VYDEAYNHAWIRALVTGELTFDPQSGVTEDRPELAGTLDVLGINYYSRAFIVPFDDTPLGGIPCSPPLVCGERNDLEGDNGNEVYPPGIYESIASMSRYGLPMFITENGVADATDEVRPSFLLMHLLQVQRAVADGYDVGGYLHWSLLDNYEWLSGFEMRFGLYEVDFDTFARTPRPDSVGMYRRVIAENGIAQELIDAWDMPGIDPR
jgi:beta-galactosidase